MEKRKLTSSKTSGYVDKKDVGRVLPVIVKVNQADYIPEGLNIREKITSYIFTSNVQPADLAILEKDKQVVSVAVNEKLKLID